MNTSRAATLYFRGLNTAGDDRLRFGFVRGPLMYRPIVESFRRRGREVVPVIGLFRGSLDDQFNRAMKFIAELPQSQTLHLIGHSAGGLIARAVASKLGPERVLSVTTLSTPHRGSIMADLVQDVHRQRPLVFRALKAVGYDVGDRLQFLLELRRSRVEEFLAAHPLSETIKPQSVSFALDRRRMCAPIAWLNSAVDPGRKLDPSDGFVQAESQEWGSVLGRFEMDHLDQIGIPVRLSPADRRRAKMKFEELIDLVHSAIQ